MWGLQMVTELLCVAHVEVRHRIHDVYAFSWSNARRLPRIEMTVELRRVSAPGIIRGDLDC